MKHKDKKQKHKAYRKVVRAVKALFPEFNDFGGVWMVKDFRGTREEDLREIKITIKNRRQDFVKDISLDQADFSIEFCRKQLNYIERLEAIVTIIEQEYRQYEQEYKLKLDIDMTKPETVKVDVKYEWDRLCKEGYVIGNLYFIFPDKEKTQLNFLDNVDYYWNKTATAIEIFYR